ncbi:MAG: ATPase [Treponema sp.]|jgi:vacuolar-type H+-ATPase subunit E/Vma4|nr:ATPase [Treponema sp.]
MEELQSTEVLDKEILEDARKKAQRILKTADETIASAEASWEKKLQRALTKIRQKYAGRREKTREEIMARLPLDKRRVRSEKVEGLLRSAMDAYLLSLPREKLLSLLEAELAKRAGEALSPSFQAACRALTGSELELMLKKVFPRAAWTMAPDYSFHKLPGVLPAIVVDTPDVRITASVDRLAEDLLLDKRAELAAALLGKEGAFDD